MTLVSSVAAILVGFSLGLLGGGGSILTVPILVYLLGYAPKTAIPVSLLIVGLGALIGAVRHFFKGNVQLKAAFAFLPSAMIGAWIGARISQFINPTLQMLVFATLTILAAAAMLKPQKYKPDQPGKKNLVVLVLSAFFVGILTGLVGVGGGFMIVPVLVFFAGMTMLHAVGTSLFIIGLNSLSGFVGYLGLVEIPWNFAFMFSAVVVVGILFGIKASDHIDNNKLKKAFAGMLLVVGTFIIAKNLMS